ncbi:MAG TPA: response regulator [Chitinophagaceae bacterium]
MILIVDDKPENLFSLKTLLEINRYETDTAPSGEEALKKILKNDYSLIILDVQMPGMDGYEVAETITGYSKTKDIPIIFLSAVHIDKRFITKGFASGGVDYITKPFDPDVLLLKVKTFCRLHAQTRELNRIKATLEQKVEERTRELREMNKALEASNAELQQYAFLASHDLQEPLRKITTFSHIVLDKYLSGNAEAAEYLHKVISSSERMRKLINDLLNYSRLSTDTHFTPTDLNELVRGTEKDLELFIKEKDARLEVGSLPKVEVIPGHMQQVFQNLVNNALKFSREGVRPEIRIWAEQVAEKSLTAAPAEEGAYTRIYVEDNGIGFNEMYLDRIFTIFQRLHGRHEYEGTGIGLALVKKIVERHNGILGARSQEGEGSTFMIVLPLTQVPAPSLTALHG